MGIVFIKNKVECVKVKGTYEPPKPLPFGAHKYIRIDGDRIPNLGRILSSLFTYKVTTPQGEVSYYEREVKY